MSTIEAGRTGRKMDSDRQTMTVEEAARKLGISRNSAYEAARQGQIPTIRIGRLLLVPKVAFDRLLEQASQ
jgi:excisionase family DNA binding protein